MPPETVKDTFLIEGGVPEYYIIPDNKFDWNDGINFMEFEFPVYCNFFIKKKVKTKFICTEQTKKKIEIIFQETLLGPKDLSQFQRDFWEGYKAAPDIKKELKHFAVNPFQPTEPLSIDMFIEFILFDDKKKTIIEKIVEVDDNIYLEMMNEGLLGKEKQKLAKKK